MSALARLRKFWLDVHLWLGVGLFIPVVLLGLSGAALVFHDELERALHPQRFSVTPGPELPPSAFITAAKPALGDSFQISAVQFPLHKGEPVIVQARAKSKPQPGARPEMRSAYIDPATAHVLEIVNPRAGFFRLMHDVHGSLLIPENGRKVVGWMGWGLLISSLTGIWLWWPRGTFLKGLRWRRGNLVSYNLHHFVGFWIAIPLAILAGTGVYISFPESARALAQWVTQSEIPNPPRGGGSPLKKTELPIDAAAAIARAAAPEAQLARLTLPTKAKGKEALVWRADLRDVRANKSLPFKITDEPGARDAQPADINGPALAMRRLHDGNDQALLWRVIVFLGGVAPALLGVTGIVLWLRRRTLPINSAS